MSLRRSLDFRRLGFFFAIETSFRTVLSARSVSTLRRQGTSTPPPNRALWALFRRGGENPPAPMNFRPRLKHLSEGFALSAPSVVSAQTFLRFPRLKKEKC